MNTIALISGAIFGLTAVVFGAFGAHLLKKKLTTEQLHSFETGVKYQMYHAIVLLVVGSHLQDKASINNYIVYAFIIGVTLFSFYIYGLVILPIAIAHALIMKPENKTIEIRVFHDH